MVTRIGGLASGMDIDSLVEKLMKAERMPLNKTFQQKQSLEWKRDAYRNVNAKLKTFDNFLLDKMILSGKMNQKTATSSNENLVSVKATSGATGNITIGGVSQLASAAQAVGNQTEYTGDSKLSELNLSVNSISIQSIGKDGRLTTEATKVNFTNDMTINDLVKTINGTGAGVTALFEGGKLSLTAKNTGSEKGGQGEIIVTGGLEVFNKLGFASTDGKLASNGKNAMFEVNGIQTERSSNTFTISGYEMTLKQTFNAGDVALKQYEAAELELKNAQDAMAGPNGLTQKYIDAANRYFGTSFSTIDEIKNATLPPSAFKTDFDTAYNGKFASTLTEQEQSVYKDFADKNRIAKLSDDDIDTIKNNDIDTLRTMSQFSAYSDADLNRMKDNADSLEKFRNQANKEADERLYQATNKNLLTNDDAITFLNSMNGKSTEEITTAINDLADGSLKTMLKGTNVEQLQFLAQDSTRLTEFKDIAAKQVTYEKEKASYDSVKSNYEAGLQREKDAEQAYANAEEVKNSTPTGGTTAAPVTMQATSDTKAAKEQITEFVEKYNEMIDEFNKQLKESKYRDYAPLTAEQRKDMSENEQKLWDEKAKSGLLRSDSIIRDGMAKMRDTFMGSVAGLGDKFMDSLAEIGITTSKDMKNSGKLVINEGKLDAALEKDPDQVFKMFSQTGDVTVKEQIVNGKTVKVTEDSRGIAWRLRDEMKKMTTQIEKQAGRDGAVNNTFSLGRAINESDTRMTKLQAKLRDVEARYWKQFTAMEQAINKANKQSSLFS
ncbi:flagellar filament capping protein FliD [Lysinibacillus xylanilyticus]|uniref:Flagellar hook-associated protein 2 n=1 Tax=Lysinibacillus xylanilyticus TaxID=582475 RepID=A0ABT4ENP1_9BACI|nr:flagellar filament capping protein FliD [Lysinibacillus xylanilyticus]MCY9546111.1 flagellar filament capping protein FliD [Lysinibacillus xylanilyticus]